MPIEDLVAIGFFALLMWAVLAHIATGMYGAIVVQPKQGLPPVDNEYVLVASEWPGGPPEGRQPQGDDDALLVDEKMQA